jgi:hypothetical protein
MSRAGFGRDPCMRNAKSSMFEDARAKKRCKRARGGCVVCERGRRIGVGIGERLERLVCAETVACNTSSVLSMRHSLTRLTNKKHQAFSGSFLRLHAVLAHAMDDGTRKVR